MSKPKTLAEFVKHDCADNIAEAARRLDTDYNQVRRWLDKTVKAGRSSRKLMLAFGVVLP